MSEKDPGGNGVPRPVHTGHDEPEHELVELALGSLTEPRRSELVTQLSACPSCRTSYDEIVGGIDVVLPAAPYAAPPAGFDVSVLEAMGMHGKRPPSPTRLPAPRRRVSLLVAAAAVVVALAGGAAIAGLVGTWGEDTARPQAADSSGLVKDDGDRVGTATVGWLEDQRVLVLSVTEPVVGVGYRCRLLLEDGERQTLARWEAASAEGGTWVVPTPKGELAGVELVTDSGEVWASASLPG